MSWGEVSSSPSHVSLADPTSNYACDPAETTKDSESTGQTISTSRLHYEPLRGHSSAGRASVWQTEGRRFEPGWLHLRRHCANRRRNPVDQTIRWRLWMQSGRLRATARPLLAPQLGPLPWTPGGLRALSITSGRC